MGNDTEIREQIRLYFLAEIVAKRLLKSGDRVRAVKCPGTERTFSFSHWAGHWMVSKSGIDDYSPMSIRRINGKKIDMHAMASQCTDDVSQKVENALRQRRERRVAAGTVPF
ncbi:hypothetical protein HW932_21125 [Allochromatium humboldtianum]|uniref:Uncharacterized protein n=1 Tax=Allochromatium humboldtianum TaxID=504901 RepID=A0A850RS57_9GAMM|nr:hypothetical protein [Allochromatium humboldtianum]NVZ11753.1 hypothetical protein [Allochromatium humboldtianum]